MSFRTEANKVKAGIARGDFKKKRDYWASFVDPLVSQMQKQDAIKIQEDLDKRREVRAEARELRKLQTAQDAQDKKDEALVNAFMLTQGARGEVARSQVSSLVKSGFNDMAKLTEYFEKNARYVIGGPEGPNVPSDVAIGDLGQSVRGSDKYLSGDPITVGDLSNIAANTEGYNSDAAASEAAQMADILKPVTGEAGKFEFGKQPEKVDLTKLRNDNWESYLAAATKDENLEAISDINAWAKSRGLTKIVGQVTQEKINGASLEELRKLDLQYADTPEIKAAIAIEEKLATNQQPWNNPQELAGLDLNVLQAYKAGSSKLGKSAQANIDDAIQLKLAIDKSKNLAEVSLQFDKDSSFYDAALRQLGEIDATSPTATQDLQTFKALTDLKSLAVEKEKEAKYQDMRNLNAKEQALQAFYTEKGFFVTDTDGSVVVPSSGDMAEFERDWKQLTDISEKPLKWFENDQNLLKLTTTQMKALIDTGLLPPEAQTKVEGFYTSMQNTGVIERMTSTEFNSTTDIDQFIASQGIDKLSEIDDDSLTSLIAQRRVLLDKENQEQTDYNAYQEAATIFFTNNPKTYENILKFEQEYKAGTAVPKEDTFQSRTLFDFTGRTVTVKNLKEQREAEAAGYSIYQPSEIDIQITNLGLADTEDNRRIIQGVKNGTYKLSKDFAGRTTIVDLTTQTSEGVKGTPIPIEQVVGQDGELQINVTQEQIDQAAQFKEELNKIPDDVEEGMAGAVGIKGVVNKLLGKAADLAGWKAKQDNLAAMNFVTNLRVYTMVTLAAAQGTRDSVWQKQQILSTLPETARFWQGPMETGNKVRDTLSAISNSISILETNRDSGTVTGSDLSKITQQLTNLGELQKVYTELDGLFKEVNGTAQKKTDTIEGSIFFKSKKNRGTE